MRHIFLNFSPLLLAAGFVLSGAGTAQAQITASGGFTFTAPTSSTLIVNPGDIITVKGTFKNQTALEQLDDVTLGLSPGSYGGKFTFASPFFATLGIGQSQSFTGTLKINKTAQFNPTTFYLDANGTGDSTGETYDFGSSNFTVKLEPAAVPEASSLISTAILLAMGVGTFALGVRKKRAAKA